MHTGTSYRVVSAVLGARRVGSSGRDKVAHGQVLRELETVSHVRLSPAQHGSVDGNGKRRVTGSQGALHELRRDYAVL